MRVLIDTNVILRYLLNDDARSSAEAVCWRYGNRQGTFLMGTWITREVKEAK